jgi:hypothetical protein
MPLKSRPLGTLAAGFLISMAIALSSSQAGTPSNLDAYPAVYAELSIEHRIAADGGVEEIRRARLRLQSETGAEWFGRITVPVRSGDAVVQVVSAGVRHEGEAERSLDAARLRQAATDAAGFRVYRASNSPACSGPFAAPLPLSCCDVVASTAALRTIGRHAGRTGYVAQPPVRPKSTSAGVSVTVYRAPPARPRCLRVRISRTA